MLIGDYFTIKNRQKEQGDVTCSVLLNPEHKVYAGHFPGMPVCPGVCNIQMIKECAEEAMGEKYGIDTIAQCKFSSVITPDRNKEMLIHIQISEAENGSSRKVKAQITNPDQTITFIQFKGEFSIHS